MIANLEALPPASGAYALIIRLRRRLRAWPNAGPVLTPGLYLYAGSAKGPGGIRARVQRHARHDKRRHWHVDRLTSNAPVVAAAALPGGNECLIVEEIVGISGVTAPVPGFGSSDCRFCPSHLLRLPPDTDEAALKSLFPDAAWWARTTRLDL
jgi:Uri superfamily endonuclease